MQHFLCQPSRQALQNFLRVFAFGQQFAGTCHFGFAPLVCLRIQLLNEGHGAALHQPVHEALNARINDHFGFGHSRLAVGLARLNDAGQIVDGVKVNVF